MPNLGDIVGSFMAEFTLARVRADLEAVKLMTLYRSEGLLDGASVPRFRLPDITIDLPMVISGLEGETTTLGIPRPSLEDLHDILREANLATGNKLDEQQKNKLIKRLNAYLTDQWAATDEPIDRAVFLTKGALTVARETLPQSIDFLRALTVRFNSKILGASGQGARLSIIAKTSDLRELGDPSLITRMTMTFKEDGFEIVSIERPDGSTDLRLTPE